VLGATEARVARAGLGLRDDDWFWSRLGTRPCKPARPPELRSAASRVGSFGGTVGRVPGAVRGATVGLVTGAAAGATVGRVAVAVVGGTVGRVSGAVRGSDGRPCNRPRPPGAQVGRVAGGVVGGNCLAVVSVPSAAPQSAGRSAQPAWLPPPSWECQERPVCSRLDGVCSPRVPTHDHRASNQPRQDNECAYERAPASSNPGRGARPAFSSGG